MRYEEWFGADSATIRSIVCALELVDQVRADEKLIAGRSVVISGAIPGVVKTDLRPNHNCVANILRRVQRIFGVLGWDAGALSLLVV